MDPFAALRILALGSVVKTAGTNLSRALAFVSLQPRRMRAAFCGADLSRRFRDDASARDGTCARGLPGRRSKHPLRLRLERNATLRIPAFVFADCDAHAHVHLFTHRQRPPAESRERECGSAEHPWNSRATIG